jgi:hypothetical protein
VSVHVARVAPGAIWCYRPVRLLSLGQNLWHGCPSAQKPCRQCATRVPSACSAQGDWTDQYDSLQPVADLRNQLQVQLYLMVQRADRVGDQEGEEPDDDEKQVLIDTMSNAITKKLMELTRRRLASAARPIPELIFSAAKPWPEEVTKGYFRSSRDFLRMKPLSTGCLGRL